MATKPAIKLIKGTGGTKPTKKPDTPKESRDDLIKAFSTDMKDYIDYLIKKGIKGEDIIGAIEVTKFCFLKSGTDSK